MRVYAWYIALLCSVALLTPAQELPQTTGDLSTYQQILPVVRGPPKTEKHKKHTGGHKTEAPTTTEQPPPTQEPSTSPEHHDKDHDNETGVPAVYIASEPLLGVCFGIGPPSHNVRNAALCASHSVNLIVSVITLGMVIYKLRLLHLTKRPLFQQIVFYLASAELLVFIVDITAMNEALMQLIYEYLRVMQLLILSGYYCSLACHIFDRVQLQRRVAWPVIGSFLLYYFAVIIYGLIIITEDRPTCHEPVWLMLSVPEFANVLIFVTGARFIVQRLKLAAITENYRRRRCRELWALVASYALAATFTMVADVVAFGVPDDKACYTVIGESHGTTHAILLFIYSICTVHAPIWTMYTVFETQVKNRFQYVDDEEEDCAPAPPLASTNESVSGERRPLLSGRLAAVFGRTNNEATSSGGAGAGGSANSTTAIRSDPNGPRGPPLYKRGMNNGTSAYARLMSGDSEG
eukprot:Clim_evm63s203 gene=Clim_evmTU63s203